MGRCIRDTVEERLKATRKFGGRHDLAPLFNSRRSGLPTSVFGERFNAMDFLRILGASPFNNLKPNGSLNLRLLHLRS